MYVLSLTLDQWWVLVWKIEEWSGVLFFSYQTSYLNVSNINSAINFGKGIHLLCFRSFFKKMFPKLLLYMMTKNSRSKTKRHKIWGGGELFRSVRSQNATYLNICRLPISTEWQHHLQPHSFTKSQQCHK